MTADHFIALKDAVAAVTVGHVGPMASEYQDSGVPFLRSLNIRPHRLDMTDVKYVSPAFHHRLKKSALHPGDVAVVRTGKPGVAACIPADAPEMNCSDLVVIRPGPLIDGRWLSYYINGAAAGYVSAQLVGAVQQHFNIGSARTLLVPSIPLARQQAIAEVLGALDDKIAANTSAGLAAENLALALMSRYPVRTALGDIAVITRQTVSPKTLPDVEINHYSLPAYDIDRLPVNEIPSAIKSTKFRISQPCVLVSKLNPRFPRVWPVVSMEEPEAVASTEFMPVVGRACSAGVLYSVLAQPSFGIKLESQVVGTSGSHQRVRPEDMLRTEICNPQDLDDTESSTIESLVLVSVRSRVENRMIAKLRDTLLPHLMSGKIVVKDAERQVEAVV